MIGVPINGLAYMFGDNMSVVNDASIPQCNIYKKHLGICYHAFWEASAAGICRVKFVKGDDNIYYWVTNIMSGTSNEK